MSDRSIISEFLNIELIYNRNEKLILKELERLLQNQDPRLTTFSEKDFRDVYALANNHLDPKYVQKGTIVLSNDITKEEVEVAVEDAIYRVFTNPKK